MLIRQKVSERILKLRAIERILKSEDFEKVYNLIDDKSIVEQLITNEDKKGLLEWVKKQTKKNSETFRALRNEARIRNIPEWHKFDQRSLHSILYREHYDFQNTTEHGTT